MRFRYICMHEESSSIHKDGYELVRLNRYCDRCIRLNYFKSISVKIVVKAHHTLTVRNLARVAKR